MKGFEERVRLVCVCGWGGGREGGRRGKRGEGGEGRKGEEARGGGVTLHFPQIPSFGSATADIMQ